MTIDEQMDLELSISTERFFIKDKAVEEEVLNTPKVDEKKLLSIMKPGDLLLVYPKLQDSKSKTLSYKLNSFFQRMAFSSIKIVGYNKNAMGYDITGDMSLNQLPLKDIISKYSGILVLRHKEIKPSIAKKICDWVYDKFTKHIPYDYLGVLKSIVRRLLNITGEVLSVKNMEANINKLYCSTVLHLGYKAANLSTGITSVGDFDVFPKDFLTSSKFKKVALYLQKGELEASAESIQLEWQDKRNVLEKIVANITTTDEIDDKKDFSEYLLQRYLDRTEMHMRLVHECGLLLTPMLSKYNIDLDQYNAALVEHDRDKLDPNNIPAIAIATQFRYNSDINRYFKPSSNILDEYDKTTWPAHYSLNSHHVGEHYGKLVDRTWVVDEDNHPLAIMTMFADWMAMGVELENSAGAWWEKCKNEKKYSFQPNDVKMIEELLEFEKTIDRDKLPNATLQVSVYGAWTPAVRLADDKTLVICAAVSDDTHLGVCYFHDIPVKETLTADTFHCTILGQNLKHSDNPTCRLKESIARSTGRNSREYILTALHDCDPPKELTIDYNVTVAKYPHIKEFILNMVNLAITKNIKPNNESLTFEKKNSAKSVISTEGLSYYIDTIFDMLATGIAAFSKLQNTYRIYRDLNKNSDNFVGKNEDAVSKNTKGWLNPNWFTKIISSSKNGIIPDIRLSKNEFNSKFNKFGYDKFGILDVTVTKPLNILGYSKCADIRDIMQKWMHAYFFRVTMVNDWVGKIKSQIKLWSTEEQTNAKHNLKTILDSLNDLKIFLRNVAKEINRYYESFRKGKVISNEEYTTIKNIIDENTTFNIGTEDLKPSLEAGDPKISSKKKAILDHICKHCDIMDPSKFNSERYKKLISGMTDKQFDTFMKDMRDGRFQLHLVAPNMKVNLKVPNMIKCADSLKLKLFHKIWMKDNATGKKFLSDNEYLVIQIPVRRQEQFIDKKMSVPDNDRSIDGLTGQVSWDSKASSITNPEIQILAARNMEATLHEFVNVRGGNIHSYAEFKRSLEENGEARLNDLDPSSRTRTAVMGGVLLTAMLIDNNL